MQKKSKTKIRPLQKQNKPGLEAKLSPPPESEPIQQNGKLKGKTAIITGGDSGIGKATALLFAAEGADIVISYLSETSDAKETKKEIETLGRKCILVKGDLGRESNCKKVIKETVKNFGKLDILVNNAGIHWESEKIEDITTEQLMKTFHSNFFNTART